MDYSLRRGWLDKVSNHVLPNATKMVWRMRNEAIHKGITHEATFCRMRNEALHKGSINPAATATISFFHDIEPLCVVWMILTIVTINEEARVWFLTVIIAANLKFGHPYAATVQYVFFMMI